MTTLVRFNPTRELNTMRNDVDKLFNAFFNNPPATHNRSRSWGLALDVTEDKEAFNVIASVPGFSRDEIDITVDDGVLKISGEVKVESDESAEEEAKVRYHLRERRTGRFSRNLRLPKDINVDEITATHENGVLTLRLPKTPEVQPKRISIN